MNRRAFLTRLAALGAVPALGGGSAAQTSTTAPSRLDVHQHFVSPAYLAALTAKNAAAPRAPRIP